MPNPAAPNDGAFPGGSKRRVNRAGESLRIGLPSAEDLHVFDEWRAAHRVVLNTFQATLRGRTKGKPIIVAQRHKRRNTIIGKLAREPSMKLVRMDDVAGCRLIFRDETQLRDFRTRLHKARFKHRLRHDEDKYDYIRSPKATGYRGIHDVYEYNVSSKSGEGLRGLYIEIQYRTLIQHAWATAVEVIGFVTENQPKFREGDTRYVEAMALASEILARAHEGQRGPFAEIPNDVVLKSFLALDEELGLLKKLKGLNESKAGTTEGGNLILIFDESGKLEVKSFRDATEALRNLFQLEKSMPLADIVLVRADSGQEIKDAFRNYFSNAKDFVRLIEQACAKLSGRDKTVRVKKSLRRKAGARTQ
jgi:ppGpp synthetase/RelA/SpoT-type nucleotidyltranferase